MSILFTCICVLFIQPLVFCQTENKIPTIREIYESKGKLTVETYYPVDTTTYHKKIVFLDASFNISPRHSESIYFLSQNINYEGREIPRLRKKGVVDFHLDSTVTIKKMEDGLEVQYTHLINGQITYKRGFKLFDCTIENGNLTKIKKTNRDRSRTYYFSDFSGLNLKTNKTWPTHTVYNKEGSIKLIIREMYHNENTYLFEWKPE